VRVSRLIFASAWQGSTAGRYSSMTGASPAEGAVPWSEGSAGVVAPAVDESAVDAEAPGIEVSATEALVPRAAVSSRAAVGSKDEPEQALVAAATAMATTGTSRDMSFMVFRDLSPGMAAPRDEYATSALFA
jgi:hypothetical protein